MISLLSLLLSSITDASEDRVRRARAHELRGRIGLRAERETGTRARYRYLLDRVHDYESQRDMVELWEILLLHDDVAFESRPSYTYTRRPEWPDDLVTPATTLPLSGQSSTYDPLIPWSAVLLDVLHDSHEPRTWRSVRELGEQLMLVRDWFVHEHPDLSGLSWDDALGRALQWHEQFVTQGFGLPVEDATVLARWPDGATLQRLDSKEELADEGTSMGHCVGGPIAQPGDIAPGGGHYWQAVRDGELVILSYRDADGLPHATLAVAPSRPDVRQSVSYLSEIQGPENRPVDDAPFLRSMAALALAGMGRRWHRAGLEDPAPELGELYDEPRRTLVVRFLELVSEEQGREGSLAWDLMSAVPEYESLQSVPLHLDLSPILSEHSPLSALPAMVRAHLVAAMKKWLAVRVGDRIHRIRTWSVPPVGGLDSHRPGIERIQVSFKMTNAPGRWRLHLVPGDVLWARGHSGAWKGDWVWTLGWSGPADNKRLGVASAFEEGQPEKLLREHVDLPSTEQMRLTEQAVTNRLKSMVDRYGPSNVQPVLPAETWLLSKDAFRERMGL